MEIVIFLALAIIIAMLCAFCLILMRKWEIIEYVQVNGNEFFAKMFSCDFCLSFWASVIVSIIFAVSMQDIRILLMPFVTTPITRFVL